MAASRLCIADSTLLLEPIKSENKMKIVKVIGGLGNQMFQFALYKALQKQHPEERILLDFIVLKAITNIVDSKSEKCLGPVSKRLLLERLPDWHIPTPISKHGE